MHTGYGGIRASAGARIGGQLRVGGRNGNGNGPTNMSAPMATAPPRANAGPGPDTYQVLVVLVLLEALTLVLLRGAFRHYHGG